MVCYFDFATAGVHHPFVRFRHWCLRTRLAVGSCICSFAPRPKVALKEVVFVISLNKVSQSLFFILGCLNFHQFLYVKRLTWCVKTRVVAEKVSRKRCLYQKTIPNLTNIPHEGTALTNQTSGKKWWLVDKSRKKFDQTLGFFFRSYSPT